tara:strand:- start:816 stop:1754 length:939 start_codon:yes stop_codon:yes gene_type:complete
MLALCTSSCLVLAPSAGLLPDHERPQLPDVRGNKTAFITLAAAQDPCQIDPAVCAGASQDVKDDASQRYDAPVFTSSLRLASVMLNLHSVAHMMKQTDCVIVFPGYAEDERMEAAIAYAERLSAGTLFVAGPPESDKDSALEWTLPKIQAKRTALGFGKSAPPYGIVIESEAADTKKQAEQVASFFKTKTNPDPNPDPNRNPNRNPNPNPNQVANFFKKTPDVRRALLVTTSWHMPRAYLSLVKSVMTQMGDVRAVQVLPMVAPRPLGQDVRYYLATHGGTPKPQSAAADSEQVRHPSNCPCVLQPQPQHCV